MWELAALGVGLKVLAAGGAIQLGWQIYKRLPGPRYRLKMVEIFRKGGLYIIKRPLNGDKEIRIFPNVENVWQDDIKTVIVFSIPFGLEPSAFEEKAWLFRQGLGTNMEMVIEDRRGIITIYHTSLPGRYNYDFNKVKDAVRGMSVPVVVGQSATGLQVYDMAVYPHLLIAGETGSGKSSQLRSILTTLALTKTEHELEMYLCDLKRTEFFIFRNVRNVKRVATDYDGLMDVLYSVEAELKRRGELLDHAECVDLSEFNDKHPDAREPYIIVAIDEAALIKKDRQAMQVLGNISAIGRALGVFLILSMQRPDAEVIDGKLKNNLTVRMAFRCADGVNSRIIIDSDEAAKIKIDQKGRMVWKHEGLVPVQAPWLSPKQAKALLEPVRKSKEIKVEQVDDESEHVFGLLSENTPRGDW